MNNSNNTRKVVLRVSEALQADVGQCKARVGSAVRSKLGLMPGDIIGIEGTKSSGAIVAKGLLDDEDKEIIRIDGVTRKNISISVGEKVNVHKAKASPAKKISLALVVDDNHKIQFGKGVESVVKRWINKKPVNVGDLILVQGIGGIRPLPFGIVSTSPKGIVVVDELTEIIIQEECISEIQTRSTHVSYEDIGGLREELKRVREMIELPLRHPELFDRLGISPPKGVLLHGPPGTGKTMIARAVAGEARANFYSIQGPEIMSKYYGESEGQLRQKFEEAEQNAPSIIFIDEIDSIAPKRSEVQGEVERRVVAQLLTLMDGLKSRGRVIVIAATNRVDAIDPALRRPGRFDREIEAGVPDTEGRKEIFQVHTRGMPLEKGFDLDFWAANLHGFVGADIAALCREAAMKALRRYIPEIEDGEEISPKIVASIEVTMEDFREAKKEVEPSALREVLVEVPNVNWDKVGGLEGIKKDLREFVEWPLTKPEVFREFGIKPTRGILLYGPPGTGKTLLARAIASEVNANFIAIKGPEVFSKWVGDSEKAVREVFKKAKQYSPSIVFLDEIDSLAPKRGLIGEDKVTERVVNQLLTSMDGLEDLDGVVVVGATNRPDVIDPALLRSGRFDKLLLVGAPDEKARKSILKIHTDAMPLATDVVIETLAKKTNGYSGADIEALCREAGVNAIRDERKKVTKKDFEYGLDMTHPTLDDDTIKYYQNLQKEIDDIKIRKKKSKEFEVSYL